MSHSSGGVIYLDESNANGEEVGPDVVEGFLILSSRRFDSPNLDEQQKILVVSSTRALDNLGCKPSIYPSMHVRGKGGCGEGRSSAVELLLHYYYANDEGMTPLPLDKS